MTENSTPEHRVDWRLTTWDGARREALRRWAQLPLERTIAALEEMEELSELLAATPRASAETAPANANDRTPARQHMNAFAADFTAMDEAALIACLREHEDRAPRSLVDACAARGDAMVQALENRLDDPEFWDEEVPLGDWWLRLHAAMILGLIRGERAARLLAELMRRLDAHDDPDMQDWLAGAWTALFANKPTDMAAALGAITDDRACGTYLRLNAAEPYLALSTRASEAALDSALDHIADLAADAQEDGDLRAGLGNLLLDFPRPRHRPLLERLAALQAGIGVYFSAEEIEQAYARGHDAPEWERFENPWKFYAQGVIEARQRRWADEDLNTGWDDVDTGDDAPTWQEPYVRPQPKIGRNDPCPCGSGKKYKKCCLGRMQG